MNPSRNRCHVRHQRLNKKDLHSHNVSKNSSVALSLLCLAWHKLQESWKFPIRSVSKKALAAGYSALFTTLSHLAEALESAPYPSLMRQRLRRYTSPSVLVIDEVGYTKLSPAQAHYFFELVTARYEHGSILLTSNTSFADWGSLLGDEILATALLDRLLHHAEVIAITGPSYRMKDRREAVQALKGGGQK